jgi:DNA-directed RNA polymerase specialized sigma24 family protein
MAGDLWPKTRWTLLRDLAHAGSEAEWNRAWARFVDQYGPGIVVWCRKWGLKQYENDVCQAVLRRLFPAMRTYEVRRWFGSLVQTAAAELLAESGRDGIEDLFLREMQRRRGEEKADQRLKREWMVRLDDDAWQQLTLLSRLRHTEEEQLALDAREALRGADPATAEGKLLQAAEAVRGRGSLLEVLEQGAAAGLAKEQATQLADLKRCLALTHRTAWAAEWVVLEEIFRPAFRRWCQDVGFPASAGEAAIDRILPLLRRVAESLDATTLPKFRSWLFKVMENAIKDCYRELARLVPAGENDFLDGVLTNTAAQADFTAEVIRQEERTLAEERVRQAVNPLHWEMYWLMVHEGVAGKDVAARLKLANPNSVWQTVKRVRDKVREEIRSIEQSAEAEEGE